MYETQQDLGDLLDDLERALAKTYETMNSLISASKPTKGAVEDLAAYSFKFNLSLHNLQLATSDFASAANVKTTEPDSMEKSDSS
ncbi:hypothetical protein NSK_001029 [Nannochloropsis salina CCMP1776]|uniref:Uncharacterized protein n=1 Tax=Nannochloropsis salina CCMP1776 TaxID=1027361 RepID=A0A4D9DG15_9STRA|nr:hypothetical protein NSK_001029 [Nannochloropsis salina CCMP1776]|eukprot:TFJ87679.1 hypothetical protein NSK_001029 [Nannochloropsis salina CCMP1776]